MRRQLSRSAWSYVLVCPTFFLFYIGFVYNGYLISGIMSGEGQANFHVDITSKVFRKLLEKGPITLDSDTGNNTDLEHRLPGCIIIGARKCGTRALIEFLKLHPQIVSPNDEMHFFSNDSNYRLGLDWYRQRMPLSRQDQITLEKTPKYFISHISPSRVHRMNSSVKLIAILRHPTVRVISDYTQTCANKAAKNETLEAFELRALDRRTGHINPEHRATLVSTYHRHISRWLQLFPLRQLHLVDGDNLIVNPLQEIRKVEAFLNLQPGVSPDSLYFNSSRGFFCMRRSGSSGVEQCLGANKGRKHVNISEKTLAKLNRFFKPHNEQLFKLIGRRFFWR